MNLLPDKLRNILRVIRRSTIPDFIWHKIKLPRFHSRVIEQVVGPLTYNQDGLATQHNCDFIKNKRFAHAYKMGKATGSWGDSDIQWRAHVLCWAAQKGMSIEGDFVECGVNKGGGASVVLHYTELYKTTRKFYLLDTFNGLIERYISKDENKMGIHPGRYEECFDSVQRTFAEFPNVIIIRGAVPETLAEVPTIKIAFLSIDMNCVEPEIAAAEYFWDWLAIGAVMVLDDYGWTKHILQKIAFDRFATDRGVEILSLPTGQGLIIKQ